MSKFAVILTVEERAWMESIIDQWTESHKRHVRNPTSEKDMERSMRMVQRGEGLILRIKESRLTK